MLEEEFSKVQEVQWLVGEMYAKNLEWIKSRIIECIDIVDSNENCTMIFNPEESLNENEVPEKSGGTADLFGCQMKNLLIYIFDKDQKSTDPTEIEFKIGSTFDIVQIMEYLETLRRIKHLVEANANVNSVKRAMTVVERLEALVNNAFLVNNQASDEMLDEIRIIHDNVNSVIKCNKKETILLEISVSKLDEMKIIATELKKKTIGIMESLLGGNMGEIMMIHGKEYIVIRRRTFISKIDVLTKCNEILDEILTEVRRYNGQLMTML